MRGKRRYGRGAPPRRLVFLWENIGPAHADRLAAVAAHWPGIRVVAIELFAADRHHPWPPTPPAGYRRITLAAAGERIGAMRLAWRLVRRLVPLLPRADCYLCHYQRGPVLLAAWLAAASGRRPLALFTSKFDDRPRRLWREGVKRLFLLPYRGGLCGSPRARDYLRFLGVPLGALRLGYNAVAVDRIVELAAAPPAPAGVPHGARDFLVVARLVPKKNLPFAVHAFALWLAASNHPRDLHLCGAGPEEATLRAEAARLGVAGRVHFHGYCQTEAVAHRLAHALCLLLPSTTEQFGNVVIEAQAMGVPALVSRVAGAADLLIDSGRNGYVIAPHDPRGCAALMARLADDPAHWAALAREARADSGRGDAARFVAGVAGLSRLASP